MVTVYFQDIDFSALSPVRYTRLGHKISGLCVSEPWVLVADYWNNTVYLHILPDLRLHDQLYVGAARVPRAGKDGLVYVPSWYGIVLLQISSTGKMRVIRFLSTVGRHFLNHPRVAVGPTPGLLCVASWRPAALWMVNTTDDSVVQTVQLPEQCEYIWSVAALNTGQLLICYRVAVPFGNRLAFYRSMTESLVVFTDLLPAGDCVYGLAANWNRFVGIYVDHEELMVVDADGSVLHAVDCVLGKLGIHMQETRDVAVWQDCVWLGGYGYVVLLCAD